MAPCAEESVQLLELQHSSCCKPQDLIGALFACQKIPVSREADVAG
jgi:hypothetical protein